MKLRFIIFFFLLCFANITSQTIPYTVPFGYTVTVMVARVIDGDTFVTTDSIRVRLLGVDTPELNKGEDFAVEAKELTECAINGKVVRLTFETETRDIFNRVLAYVWVIDNYGKVSLFLQAELLKYGLARIRYYPEGERYYELFYNLRRTAMKNNLGIWSK